MKKFILVCVLFVMGCTVKTGIFAQNTDKIFTIYLVRHSEKETVSNHSSDPPLSYCGQQRSLYLSDFLREVNLDVIYTTNYTRTKSTAQPTADSKGLNLVLYNPGKLLDFSKKLLEKKQDALVVGHSNTTGVLAGLLAGKEIGAFDLDIYDRIYRIEVHNNDVKFQLFHATFDCK